MKPFSDMMRSSGPRRKLFEYLLEKEGLSATMPIGRVERGESLPLSLTQERIWFLEQLEPGTSAYAMGGAVRLLGSWDVQAWEGALNSIVARHESLRTTFHATDGNPVQIIADHSPLAIEVEDLRKVVRSEAEDELRRLLAVAVRRPFDLECGP